MFLRKSQGKNNMFLRKNQGKNIVPMVDFPARNSFPGLESVFFLPKQIVTQRLHLMSPKKVASQARRILSGLELFKEVTLDFRDIEYIGQAFADEIFRVFINMNPNTVIKVQNTNTEIQNMINRAVNTKL